MPTLICDMDGTLNQCNVYYRDVQREAAEYIAKHAAPLPVDAIQRLIEACNLASVTLPNGWSRHRFPSAIAAAALAACQMAGNPHQLEVARQAHAIGEQVFEAAYALYPDVVHTLTEAQAAGWRVLIFTKGDPDVQLRKLQNNGLVDAFEWGITSSKSTERWQAFLEDRNVDRGEPLVIVGDSLRDDIGPAKALGAFAVLADYGDHPAWSYDQATVEPDARITAFAGLLEVLEAHAGQASQS